MTTPIPNLGLQDGSWVYIVLSPHGHFVKHSIKFAFSQNIHIANFEIQAFLHLCLH